MARADFHLASYWPRPGCRLGLSRYLLASSLLLLLAANSGCLRGIAGINASSKGTSEAPTLALPDTARDLDEMEGLLRTMVSQRNEQGVQELQQVDGWYRKIEADELTPRPRDEYCWRHQALESFLKQHPDEIASLQTAAKSSNPWIAAAGTIGMARLQSSASPRALVRLIGNRELPNSVRCAAIETLAREQSIEREGLLRNLLEEYGPTPQQISASPALHAELLIGLARHAEVAQEPAFVEALTMRDVDVQVVALTLLAHGHATMEPALLPTLLHHNNARVRRAALAFVVSSEPAQASEQLEQALRDSDVSVRLMAIEQLGKLNDRDSLQVLYGLLDDSAERHREAAAAALVVRQEWAGVERAARDKSYRVRSAVAVGLREHGQRDRLALAETLLNDSSAIVQAKMAESLAAWPGELVGPALLASMASANLLTRQAAAQSLAAGWPSAAEFVPSAPAPERRQMLQTLASRWRSEHPLATNSPLASTASSKRTFTKAELDQIDRLLSRYQSPPGSSERWLAQKQLEKFGGDLLLALEILLQEKRVRIEEATYRELLADCHETMRTIEQLRLPEVADRRAAARKLAGRAVTEPLTSLPLERIELLVSTESDPLVWGDMLRVLGESPQYEAKQLPLAALAHDEADVRRRGCEYLARCGTYRHGQALLPLLADKDVVVKRAAVVALGRCGPVDKREPLYSLLNDSDVVMQIAAAKTLSQWQDERGKGALERFALAPTPTTRRLALVAMGELADEDFLPCAMQALKDQPTVQLAALAALPKITAEDPCVAAPQPPTNAAERAKVWQAWYEARELKR